MEQMEIVIREKDITLGEYLWLLKEEYNVVRPHNNLLYFWKHNNKKKETP